MARIRTNARTPKNLHLETLEVRLNPQGLPILDQVSHFYQVALDRAPDPQGLAYYSSQVEYGAAPQSVARQILNSTEHHQKIVTGYYNDILGRQPDASGLASHVTALGRGAGEERLVASFLASPEKSGGLTNTAYVNLLYSYILGRTPEQSGEEFWVSALQSGATRQAVAMAFLQSREATNLAVDGLYQSVLGRQPTGSEKQGWINYLRRPDVTYADAAAAFLASSEAAARLAGVSNPLLTVTDPNPVFWQKTIGLGNLDGAQAPAAQLKLNPVVQLSHFGQDIAFTETAFGILTIPITSGGSGYSSTSPPAVKVAAPAGGGQSATATATVQNGVITGWTISNNSIITGQKGPYFNPSTGAVVTPSITITDPNNPNNNSASFTANLDDDGNFIGLKNVKGGQGYDPDNLPTVTVSGALDPTKNATILINKTGNNNGIKGGNFDGITDGVVTAITVNSPGKGYAPDEQVTVTIASPPSGGIPAVIGSPVSAGAVEVASRAKFQAWANDYISFVANTGVSTAIINIGDYRADTKGLYNYLRPELGSNGIPWIVTDFLEPLGKLQKSDGSPADIQVGACAYLKDAWHLYGNETPDGSEDPANVNFEGNVFITDGKKNSPPKNNIYQAFELINDINSMASTKFITYFEFDGEGGSAFVPDTNYAFNGSTTPNSSWSYTPTTDPTSPGKGTWPTTGTGYTKWLWNHLMPGVAQADLALGGSLPASAPGIPAPADIPDVVWSDAQAMDPLTWSENKYGNAGPYQYGSISYKQPAWFINSLGPVRAYSENYWWGENNYMPGGPSAISPDGKSSSVPFQIPVTDSTVFDPSKPVTVTFNTPTQTGPDGSTITGTPAAGYAVLATGSVAIAEIGTTGIYSPADPSGLIPTNSGTGYSTGIWISAFPAEPGGYQKTDTIFFKNPNLQGRGATGTLDVDNNNNITGVTITDPGTGWLQEPTEYTINNNPDPNTGSKKATFTPLLTPANGYPTLSFQVPSGSGSKPAQGYALVTSQTYKPGSIAGIVITDPGEGYEKTNNTQLDGLSTALLQANIAGGKVVSVTVLNGGSGYTSPPTITFANPYQVTPSTQAAATAVLGPNGQIQSVTITNGGAGYYPNDKSDGIPPVTATPPTSGKVSGVTLAISSSPAPSDILGQYSKTSGATTFTQAGISLADAVHGFYLQVSHSANTVDHVVVTRLGDHYSAECKPTFTISDGAKTSPTFAASLNTATYNKAYAPIFDLSGGYIINGNGQSLVTVLDGGSGYSAGAVVTNPGHYTLAPTVSFSSPTSGGTTATGFVNWDQSSGKVISIQVTNPGSGYTQEPTISFQAAQGDTSFTPATAEAHVRNYPIVSIQGGIAGSKPATAYALVSPTDTQSPDYDNGCYVTGIAFTFVGSGYVPPGSSTGVPPAITQAFINALPIMTVSAPPQNPAGTPAIVDGQFAIASKWNAFWLDGVGSINSQMGKASTALPESVGSVTVTNPGSGYGWDVQVTFSAPSKGIDIATGYAVLNPDGSINRIAITNPGSGYTSVPTATIFSASKTGTGASLNVNPLIPKIRGGGNVYNYTIWNGTPSDQVTSIDFVPVQNDGSHTTGGNVYQNGSGYKPNDTVVFTRNPADQPAPAGQTYADAEAVVSQVDSNGAILAFSITKGGSGYQAAPSAVVQSAAGTGAAIQPSLQNLILSANGADAVYAHYAAYPEALAQMFNDPLYTAEPLPKLGSSYYQKLDYQQDNAQSGGGGVSSNSNGIGQSGIATFSLESVLLSNTGPEAVKLGAVQVANAVATVQNGVVTQLVLAQGDTGGANYTYPPQVVFGGPGTGAAATAIIQGGKVTGFNIINGGSGYSTAPTVTLASGCLDSKYHSTVELNDLNGLGGTFGGLSMLTYNDFIRFLNNAADIIVGSQKQIASNVTATDYTYNQASPSTILFNGANTNAANIRVGMTVEGVGVPAGTVVQAIPKATATAVKNPSNGNWTISVDQGPENTGYLASGLPNVVITGDGSGATGTATVDPASGKVTSISLTYSSTATSYTWMNVSIQQSQQVLLSKPLTATPGALTFYNPISASDVTFSIYDSAFLPLSWLDGQVTNGWKEANTAPKFSGLLTAGTIAHNALAGTVIHTEVATDNDLLAANKRITYDLKRGLADDARLLRINPSTGQVMLRYDASHFPRQSYTFTVVATDGGGLSVQKTVTVPVVYT